MHCIFPHQTFALFFQGRLQRSHEGQTDNKQPEVNLLNQSCLMTSDVKIISDQLFYLSGLRQQFPASNTVWTTEPRAWCWWATWAVPMETPCQRNTPWSLWLRSSRACWEGEFITFQVRIWLNWTRWRLTRSLRAAETSPSWRTAWVPTWKLPAPTLLPDPSSCWKTCASTWKRREKAKTLPETRCLIYFTPGGDTFA